LVEQTGVPRENHRPIACKSNQPIESDICTVSSDCRFAFHRCCLFFQIIISILSY
jgi:hypothetical protein